MSEERKFVRASEINRRICEAMGIDPATVQRIVLDLQANRLPVIYVQYIGDTRLMDVDWESVAPFLVEKKADGSLTVAGR